MTALENSARIQDDCEDNHESSKLPNPFTVVRVLAGHSDIATRLVKLDERLFASYGDDGKVIIWDIESGRSIYTLEAHSRRVTCSLLLDDKMLLTGSSDRTIRAWRTDSGALTKEMSDHKSSVKCLTLIWHDGIEYFCSGGDDLCLWSSKGELVHKLHPANDDSDIHTLLAVRNERIVAATADSATLDCYQLVSRDESLVLESCDKKLPSHREAIRCLIPISDAMFASGSLDGVIYLWSTHTVTVARKLNYIEQYMKQDKFIKSYQYAVNQLVAVREYILAAIGRGFQVYNSSLPEQTACIADQRQAHRAPVNSVAYNQYRNIVITCSQDASIRLWELDIHSASKTKPRKLFMPPMAKRPPLLGELQGHAGSVLSLVNFGIDGFASCGHDGNVLLWKDGTRERRKGIGMLRSRTQRDCEALTASLMKNVFPTDKITTT